MRPNSVDVSRFLCFVASHVVTSLHHGPQMAVFLADGGVAQEAPSVDFSTNWDLLGPFQIGTREAPWGVDPLEYFGGFRNIERNDTATFASSLPLNGAASWTTLSAERPESGEAGKVSLNVNFNNVDWDFLQVVYGWAAFQYQGWARGEISVLGDISQNVVLYTDGALEFWVDDTHYFGGDFFTFRNAPPVLRLEPGSHRIDVRIVRDVRAFGGIGTPNMTIALDLNSTSGGLELAKESLTVSDVVDGKLASPFASIALRNSGLGEVEITEVKASDPGVSIDLVSDGAVRFAAGQTRPVAVRILDVPTNLTALKFSFVYSSADSSLLSFSVEVSHDLKVRSIYDTHKVTYLHPGSIVSYVMLRPPQTNISLPCAPDQDFPVFLQLHGAGLEAEIDQVAHAMDSVPDLCGWVLFPTGVTPWSGDDWHAWGWRDVESAISAIPAWIEAVDWQGPGVNTDRWLVSGHSNGGQGTWYALTHHPDKILAAVPASGYLSIPAYVPYQLWFPTDPRKMAISLASVNSYRHELLADNSKGIPILQQHGGADDNVPPWHSRFMHQLLQLSGWNSVYNELPGAPHYYDGIMTTDPLKEFYRSQIKRTTEAQAESFRFIVANPGDTGSKQGIRVSNLEDPGQLGIVDFRRGDEGSFDLKLSNIQALSIDPSIVGGNVVIDGQEIAGLSQQSRNHLSRSESGVWEIQKTSERLRSGQQLGAMDAIMRTNGTFTINYAGSSLASLALQVSRNLYQYYQADSEIVRTEDLGSTSRTNNIITMVEGHGLPACAFEGYPIQASASGDLIIEDHDGKKWVYRGSEGYGAIFLRPLEGEALELVVWGTDLSSISRAARLIPTITGVGQPDFVVLGKESGWRGLDGAAATGFLDSYWKVTKTSFLS